MINPTIFPPGLIHSSFASSPLGTALGLETMRMLAEGDCATSVAEKGEYFLEGLRDLQRRHKKIGEVDGLGLALRAEICTEDSFSSNKGPHAAINGFSDALMWFVAMAHEDLISMNARLPSRLPDGLIRQTLRQISE